MLITMAVVTSQDGFITKGDDPNPSSWASQEDQERYRTLLQQYPLLFIGYRTFVLAKQSLPESALKLVFSNKPMPHAENVIFVHGSPKSVIETYENQYAHALLLGGANTYKRFLKDGAVSTILLTIEPVSLGSGTQLFKSSWQSELAQYGFKVHTTTVLNRQGTVLYELVRG